MLRTEILKNGTKVITSDIHRINADGPLLASFTEPKKDELILDLCSGGGIVLLWLFDRGYSGEAVAVEKQPKAAALLRQSAEINSIDSIVIYEGAINSYTSDKKFDTVCCNAPYFSAESGKSANSQERAAARSAQGRFIFDVAETAARNLKEGGRFCCCWLPARAESLFAGLRQARLAPKRLRFCRHSEGSTPWLMLLDARLHGGEGLSVLPDFICEKDGKKTKEYSEIFI